VNPIIADISGDAYPETILGTGGYFLHTLDACGVQPAGFPKFTGQWMIGAPAVGDLDGDGTLELVVTTRAGWLYAWRTSGRVTGNVQWPTYRHDNSNTRNWGTPLPFGTRRVMDAPAITCAPRPPADGGVTTDGSVPSGDSGLPDGGTAPMDATLSDAGTDAGPPRVAGGGCACRVPAQGPSTVPSHRGALLALTALGAGFARARRRETRSLR